MPLTETEAAGTPEARVTTRTWDSRFPLKTSEVVGEVAKDWRYNDKGHVTREIVHPASEALVNEACPANSKTCHQIDYSYTYDANTQVTLRIVKTGPRPENGTTVTDYRGNGDLWKTTNALSQVDEILSFNAHGQITEQVDVNGVHTITAYNALRQPQTVTVGSDVTRYDYYTNGRLKTLTRPDASVLNYTYNPAGSVKTVSLAHDGITDSVEYQRDSRGKVLHTFASRSGDTNQAWHQTFDDKGRLLTASDGSGGWSRELKHNANNLLERSCLSGEICDLTVYTGLDQISDRARAPLLSNGALGTQIPLFSLDYDVAGRVRQVVDPVNATSVLTNNELSRHTDEDSPDFGNRGADYDLAGNETYRADSDGNSAVKQYDALNRLTRIDYSDGGALTQTWDTPLSGDQTNSANYVGRLSARSRTHSADLNKLAVAERFKYNARGDLLATEQQLTGSIALKLETAYLTGADGSGKPETLKYPGGLLIKYQDGQDGRIKQVNATLGASTTTLAGNVSYQPLINRLRGLTFGNGLSYRRDRDAGGRLSHIRLLKPDQSVVYDHAVCYDSRNRVSGYGEYSFGYDDLDHLQSQTTSQSQQRTLLGHDPNGNLKRLENYNATGVLLRGDDLSYTDNRLSAEAFNPAPAGNVSASYGYDLSGFVTGYAGNGYAYDASRAMKSFSKAGGREYYLYDALRRRVYKTGAGSTVRYVYDQADHLLFEYGASGWRNYVWLGDVPLAVIDQKADGSLAGIAYVETDFSNTPRYLRRASGDLTKPIWHWPIAPYGDTPALDDPDGDGSKVTFNLRYPGQYYDSVSGLHYNHTRYFLPRAGRYLQPDLIGLEGGTNVYTYSNGNPVNYTDPTGTVGWLIEAFTWARSFFTVASTVQKVEKAANAAQKVEKVANQVTSSAQKGAANPKIQEALRKGQQAHKEREYPSGFKKEVSLPSGKRMDAYNQETKEIIELKPNNSKAISQGERQVEGYCRECNEVFGTGHTGRVETYECLITHESQLALI